MYSKAPKIHNLERSIVAALLIACMGAQGTVFAGNVSAKSDLTATARKIVVEKPAKTLPQQPAQSSAEQSAKTAREQPAKSFLEQTTPNADDDGDSAGIDQTASQTEGGGVSAGDVADQADASAKRDGDETPADAGTKNEGNETPSESAEAASAEKNSELSKGQAVSHYWLANSYFKQWKLELAGVELCESLVYWPDLLAAHKDLCLVYFLTGHPFKALAQLMMLVGLGEPIPLTAVEQNELNEQARKLHYRQGLKEASTKNWKGAITEFQWALTYKPSDASIYRSMAFAYANEGNLDKAEECYRTTFAMSPTDAFSHADFAYLLSDNGRGTQAVEQLNEAVKLAPSAAALHVDLGWVSESSGDYATAEKEFSAAVGLSPNHAGLWTHLGKILQQEGKKKEAIEAYNRALSVDPSQDDAKQNLAKLQSAGPS